MSWVEKFTDPRLEKLIRNIDDCGHDYGCDCATFAGDYAEEAWRRYQTKKEECGDLNIKILRLEAELNNKNAAIKAAEVALEAKRKECERLQAEKDFRIFMELNSPSSSNP